MSNALAMSDTERRIAERIDVAETKQIAVSDAAGGLAFANVNQVMEMAKMMAVSSIAVPKHLRSNPGACVAVCIQAIEWRMSPFAVANKSYSVNDRLAYESQLVQAVILQRAPIKGRFKVEFTGAGDKRVCRVWAELNDGSGETVEYVSPEFGKIQPKNSPLWKTDPDQQQFYYSGRALCRRHFPDVLLGVYDRDEIEGEHVGPDRARNVTPIRGLTGKLDAIAEPRKPAPIIDPQATAGEDSQIPAVEPEDAGDVGPDFRAMVDRFEVAATEAANGSELEAAADELRAHMDADRLGRDLRTRVENAWADAEKRIAAQPLSNQADEDEEPVDPADPDYQRGFEDAAKGQKKCVIAAIRENPERHRRWQAGFMAQKAEA